MLSRTKLNPNSSFVGDALILEVGKNTKFGSVCISGSLMIRVLFVQVLSTSKKN